MIRLPGVSGGRAGGGGEKEQECAAGVHMEAPGSS